MTVTATDHPAHLAGKRSRDAVTARDKEAWLEGFADDAIVEDPIGPSAFDPEGVGHRGKEAIAAFWDKAIAPTDKIEFRFVDTFQCGNEEANIGSIVITAGGTSDDRRRRVHLPGERRRPAGGAARVLGDGPRRGVSTSGVGFTLL